jgi:hypothetical protein
MSPDDFETAVKSLEGYFGAVGVFGGNPALSRYFPDYCEILRQHFPKEQCGLWCNHPRGHGKIMRETFSPAISNLNVHLVKAAYDEFKKYWPESRPFGLTEPNRHSPVYVSPLDLEIPSDKRWELIANCDINRYWSAMISPFRGELRGYFCEIAGAMSLLKQDDPDWPDTGILIEPDWWRKPMQDFADQVDLHCHNCGVPLKGYGSIAENRYGHETISESWGPLISPKTSGKAVSIVTTVEELKADSLNKFTEYKKNANV